MMDPTNPNPVVDLVAGVAGSYLVQLLKNWNVNVNGSEMTTSLVRFLSVLFSLAASVAANYANGSLQAFDITAALKVLLQAAYVLGTMVLSYHAVVKPGSTPAAK